MKAISYMAGCLLLTYSMLGFAEKIIITGQPMILEQSGDYYVVPETSTTTTYHYVRIGDKDEVCYLEKQPNITTLEPTPIQVRVAGSQVMWHCYPYSTEYFEVRP